MEKNFSKRQQQASSYIELIHCDTNRIHVGVGATGREWGIMRRAGNVSPETVGGRGRVGMRFLHSCSCSLVLAADIKSRENFDEQTNTSSDDSICDDKEKRWSRDRKNHGYTLEKWLQWETQVRVLTHNLVGFVLVLSPSANAFPSAKRLRAAQSLNFSQTENCFSAFTRALAQHENFFRWFFSFFSAAFFHDFKVSFSSSTRSTCC